MKTIQRMLPIGLISLACIACQTGSVPVVAGFNPSEAPRQDEASDMGAVMAYKALTLRQGGEIFENDPQPGSTSYHYVKDGMEYFVTIDAGEITSMGFKGELSIVPVGQD